MAKEICISTTPHETRLAILEDDQLAEIYYERENEYTLAGSIYKGRVTRVLPGMQSSFVDVGLERDAFLYVTDFLEEQEDSDEYTSEGNGGGRPARPRAEQGDEGLAREVQGRAERSPERASERGPERNQDREGRRPGASQQPEREAAREAGREGGRAGRERAREQAVAPLREAVPAAQDLDEKGDEESPEGTRRWRGRRGRRRGVRAGLPQGGSRSPLSSVSESLEELGAEQSDALLSPETPVSIVEHGAPGGTAVLQTSPTSRERDPGRDRGRDRSPRRSREPYAQASTLDRSVQDRPAQERPAQDRPAQERPSRDAEHSRGDSRTEGSPQTHANGAAMAPAGAIVLPGESLSKYGSAPADPSVAPAAATATAPRTQRPVNYVAPKPSTLVELSGDWDGGAVMPGETLSRYRASTPVAPATSVEPAPVVASQPWPATASAEANEPTSELDLNQDQVEAPVATAQETYPTHSEESAQAELHSAPEQAGLTHPQQPESEHASSEEFAALAEPEIVAAALTPEAEAPPAHAEEPVYASAPEEASAAPEVTEEPVEPAEYEPENASASYRVQRTGPSELRLPPLEIDEPAAGFETTAEEPAVPEFQALAEPTGEFAGSEQATAIAEPADEPHAEVLEFGGTLAQHADDSASPMPVKEPWQSASQSVPPLRILHEDGTVDLAGGFDFEAPSAFVEMQHESVSGAPQPAADLPIEAHDFEYETSSPEPDAQRGHPHASEFSELVDRMQGFAPGHGLLEEETIDEEEYDFEPIHAHADEGDQEDLEEETLDQAMELSALSDAVRDSHLEQRVEQINHSPEAAFVAEEEETGFGYEEVEEGEEDFEEAEEGEETAQGAQPGEPQRSGRGDSSRGRGRSTGRGMSRNGGRRNGPGRGRSAQTQDLPIISELLKQGQEILVQIAKEPIAKKGARITSHIALPGRFLVFMPTVSHVGVSRKIASDEERQRLKRILISEKGESSGGFIVRTAAEGASEEDLRADLRFLISLWTEIKQRSDTAKAPALIYHDLNLIERILRDQVSSNFSTIWVDSEAEYERIIRFLSRFQPQLVRRVKLYTKETPLFEHFGIQEEISKALKSKVWLKSGGSIVINQTEALVAIDINTGKYVGKTSRLEDTIVKTNLDAIPEIVRQIRLRDLGGIIVIDFIDMDERKNRNRVLAALEEELKNDRAPSKVLQFNDFGLVAITRKRVKQSLERTLSVTCETCTGTGMVKSPVTVCNEIYTEMRKMLKHLDGKDVMLRVHPEVVKQLKANNGKWINELEEMVTKTIIIKSDPALHPEQFDIH
jgi:ribonuclease E